MGNSGMRISEERIRLVKEYVKPQKGARIFIADAEYCDLAIMFPDCIICGFTGWNYKQQEVWALGQIRMFAARIQSEIVSGEKIDGEYKYPLPEKNSVDYVIFRVNKNKYFPQHIFGTRCTDIEALYDLLKPNGKMLFFSEFITEMLGDRPERDETPLYDFRMRMSKERAISTIVSFEDKAILGNSGMKYVMLALTKKKNAKICIKDEMKSIMKYIDADDLDSEILCPGFYLANRPKNGIPLSAIVKLPKEDTFEQFVKENGDEFLLSDDVRDTSLVLPSVSLSDCYKDANLAKRNGCKIDDPAFGPSDWVGFSIIKEPSVFLSGCGDELRLGYTTEMSLNGLAYMPDVCCCLIPQNGFDIRYIAALLLEPLIKEQILMVCEGKLNQHVLSLVLNKIIVPSYDEKEQFAFLAEANYAAMISSQHELKLQAEDYKKSVRIRKHALTQSLSSMRSMFVALNDHRCSSNGSLKDEDKISPISTITVKDAFEFLEQKFNHMMPVVEHLADVDYSFGETKWLDPEITIENYIIGKSSGWLNFKPVMDWEHGHNQADKEMKISFAGTVTLKSGQTLNSFLFPQDAFERILDNIVSNAQSHAFTDTSRTDYQLRFSWHVDGTSLVIEIENNGTPIPSDRDTSSLLEYGVSTALNKDGHNGIGCNEIDDIMRRYDGTVKIVSTPNDVFTVKYVLTFEKTKIVSTFKS